LLIRDQDLIARNRQNKLKEFNLKKYRESKTNKNQRFNKSQLNKECSRLKEE